MTSGSELPMGFIGLGSMGQAMALNLRKSGLPLVVWNRTSAKAEPLRAVGGIVAPDIADLFARCEVVLLMLTDGDAIDAVLARRMPEFGKRIEGRTLVNMATVSPSYSQGLEFDILRAGGRYVEAPVSGSRRPAEAGQLIAMLAGNRDALDQVEPLLAPMCRRSVRCGAVPAALTMKLAINIFLIASVTGLAEATNFARSQNLEMTTFLDILAASQMASDIARAKIAKLREGDMSAEAAISNVLETNRLIASAADEAGVAAPITHASLALYAESADMGLGEADMIAVVRAFSQRSEMMKSRHDGGSSNGIDQ